MASQTLPLAASQEVLDQTGPLTAQFWAEKAIMNNFKQIKGNDFARRSSRANNKNRKDSIWQKQ
jgi:hypothetical protein